MGPFELMDLIGIDINFAAMQSMYEQTFGEPRYRPHRIQAQMVQQRALGRKSGRGFYKYGENQEAVKPPAPRPKAAAPPPGDRPVYLVPGAFAPGVEALCRQAGYSLEVPASGFSPSPLPAYVGLVGLGTEEGLQERLAALERLLPTEALIACQCADVTVAELAMGVQHPERLVGFDGLFLAGGKVATLTASPRLSPQARQAAEAFFSRLGRPPLWVEDTPGLVLPRIVSMLANEAAFALGEGVADEVTIDLAMRLGVNYPKGPLEWARALGVKQVVRVLDHLREEYGEERYRVAPVLRRWVRTDF
jgi:3-hydroxybutyryl-CoA dehydrogenase